MEIIVKGASAPQWANAEKTAINLMVDFDHLGVVPFLASSDDPEAHGRAIFEDAKAGKYGKLKAYKEDVSAIAVSVNIRVETLLAEATTFMAPLQDAVDIGEATPEEEAQLLAYKKYRVALNRVKNQKGYPKSVEWPVL